MSGMLIAVAVFMAGTDSLAAGVLARVVLPEPQKSGQVSVEEALFKRRSVREFTADSVSLEAVSQLCWAAYGVTRRLRSTEVRGGLKTAPSAGATYPLELYLVAGERGVENLPPGLYRYNPLAHSLEPAAAAGDLRAAVARASLHQTWMAEAPVMVVIAADYRRCMARYGNRGIQYTHM
ncbi:MAG: SagB/ThcOx family dehydrogenase, partial [candidate division WOR-3 bacterium]